jgi:hypothetical protein
MSEQQLSRLGDQVAGAISQQYPEFKGFRLRADAGEPGMIYGALREAKRSPGVGEELSAALDALIEQELKGEAVDFALSMGFGSRDLVLQIELRVG